MPSLLTIGLLLLTCIATAISQTLFKRATGLISPEVGTDMTTRLLGLLSLPSFWIGLVLYGAAFVLWIVLISKNSLSILYPIGMSFNVIFTLLVARMVLGETLTLIPMLGIAIIIVGIFLVAQ